MALVACPVLILMAATVMAQETCNSDTNIPSSNWWWSCNYPNMYTHGSYCRCSSGFQADSGYCQRCNTAAVGWGPDGSTKHCRPNGGVGAQRRVRKEINDWSDFEFTSYRQAFQRLKSTGEYDEFVKLHRSAAHGDDGFLPWHRKYLEDLETKLQREANDCSLTLPFWNWASETGSITNSKMWGYNRYGSLQNGCVFDGLAANWQYGNYDPDAWTEVTECVKRAPDLRGLRSLPNWAYMMGVVYWSYPYTQMRELIEAAHGSLHNDVGGVMANQINSPADPIFLAHHAFIDRMWFAWQKANRDYGESSSCGSCHSLGDYVGEYDSSDDCVMYPTTSTPRICLSYETTGGSRRLLGDISSGNECARLLAQIDAEECNGTELASIPGIDECNQGDDLFWADGVGFLNKTQMAHTGENRDSVKETMESITKFRHVKSLHPRESRPARSEAEKSTCMACDFVCVGSPTSVTKAVAPATSIDASESTTTITNASWVSISSAMGLSHIGMACVAVLMPILF